MDIAQTIRSYSSQPITHQLLLSMLKTYKRANDKIHALLNQGMLQPVKKGVYIAGAALKANKPEPFLMANHLLGPSYVSLDAALSFHNLIPERVYEITSVTIKTSRAFDTPMGKFSYTLLPLPYYSFGIQSICLAKEQYAMIATPEKALFDKIITTKGLNLRSERATRAYLLENLRMEEDDLLNFNIAAMEQWIPSASKKESLLNVVQMIKNI